MLTEALGGSLEPRLPEVALLASTRTGALQLPAAISVSARHLTLSLRDGTQDRPEKNTIEREVPPHLLWIYWNASLCTIGIRDTDFGGGATV